MLAVLSSLQGSESLKKIQEPYHIGPSNLAGPVLAGPSNLEEPLPFVITYLSYAGVGYDSGSLSCGTVVASIVNQLIIFRELAPKSGACSASRS